MTAAVICLSAVAVALAVVLAIEENLHRKERKDLINRIMARDPTEYIRIVSAGTDDKRESTRQKKAKKWRERNDN